MKTSKILEGIRVLALEQQIAAPYCTMMLADQGAEVLKIERPDIGEPARRMEPTLQGKEGDRVSAFFLRYNRNKKSITLDISQPEGLGILKQLVAKCDILVENYRPGLMEKLGLSPEKVKTINPSLIYVAISGFGRLPEYQGPYQDRLAYDIVAQAMGGLMHLTSTKDKAPTWPGVPLGDIVTGLNAAYATLLALFKKQSTGQGEFVDIAMYDCITALAEKAHHYYSLTGNILNGDNNSAVGVQGIFQTKDGYVAFTVPTDNMWRRFCKAIDREELLDEDVLSSAAGRLKNRPRLLTLVNQWTGERTSQEVCQALTACGVPCGPVQNPAEVCHCRHLQAREMLVQVPDPILQQLTLIGSPIKMEHSKPVYQTAPVLGQHTEEVLTDLLGYDAAKLSKLRQQHII